MNLPKHMPALDGLRGVAILMVLMTHVADGWPSAWAIFPGNYETATSLTLPNWLETIAASGANGVALFFVVSAFTLTVRSVKVNDGLQNYALRRMARVGPGYWIAGLAYTLIAGTAPRLWAPDGIFPTDLTLAAVFGSAWSGGASLAVVPGGWSVACEVAFYVALPVLIRVIDGRIWRAFALTGLTLLIAQVRARHAMVAHTYAFPFSVNPIEQAPVFLLGVTTALVAMRMKLPHLPGICVALLLVASVVVPLLRIPQWILLQNLPFAAIIAIVVAIAATNPPSLLVNYPIRRIGEISYSMYLIHFVLLAPSLRLAQWLTPRLDASTLMLHFSFTLAVSFILSSVTYRYVETPAIRWAARRSVRHSVVGIRTA